MLRATFRETPAFGGVLSKFKSPGLFSKTCHENHQTWLFYAIVQLCKEAKFHVQAPRKLSCKESDRYPGISIMTTLKYHCFPQNMDHLLGILGHLNLRHIPNHPTAPSKPLHVPKRKKTQLRATFAYKWLCSCGLMEAHFHNSYIYIGFNMF